MHEAQYNLVCSFQYAKQGQVISHCWTQLLASYGTHSGKSACAQSVYINRSLYKSRSGTT